MKKWILIICVALVIWEMVPSLIPDEKVSHPSVKEYIPGDEGIIGNVDVDYFLNHGEAFSIGANEEGWAVFVDPELALRELQRQYRWELLSLHLFHFKPRFASTTWRFYQSSELAGDSRYSFISEFIDIYKHSFDAS